ILHGGRPRARADRARVEPVEQKLGLSVGERKRRRLLRLGLARADAAGSVDVDEHLVTVRRFDAMGCLVEIGGATVREAQDIERLFQARDRQFSRFRPKSELSRVNRSAHEVVTVSKSFGQMVERALTAAHVTSGLVDPTLALALESAGYDKDFDELEPAAEPPVPG